MEDAYDWEGARAIVAVYPSYLRLPYTAVSACLLHNESKPSLTAEECDKAEASCRAMCADPLLAAFGLNGLGNLLRGLKRYEEAEQAYRQAIALDPKYAYPWNNLGNVMKDLERYEEAEQAYRQAIALGPEYAYPWNGLGILLHWKLKRTEEAEIAFWQALSIDRDYSSAKGNLVKLGQHWLSKNKLPQAESIAGRLTETLPEEAPAWLLLAEVEAKQNNTQQAVADLGRWLALTAPKDEAADGGWQGFGDARGLFRDLLQAGHVSALLTQLEQTGLDQRWRPLYEALKAVQAGTAAYLSRVAPEVRRPALDILKAIAPGLVEEAEL